MSSSSRPLEITLPAGKFLFSDQPLRVSTLLGSCVAITMWHPLARIGGICHFMLPYARGRAASGLESKYADDALRLFLSRIEAHGSRPQDYQVKLFGGGRQICGLADDEARSVGRQNIDAGRRLLADNGFSICGEDLADSGYRKLIFDLSNGAAEVRHGAPGVCTPAACAKTLTLESVERQTHARCHRIKAVTTFVTEGESPCSKI